MALMMNVDGSWKWDQFEHFLSNHGKDRMVDVFSPLKDEGADLRG